MKASFTKTQAGLIPADVESFEWLSKVKAGDMVQGVFTKKQNAAFHRKMFALLHLGFENWEPGVVQVKIAGEPIAPQKSFTRFRNDVTILAGYYIVVERLDGTTRIEAKSLSFDRMSAEEREDIYSKFIDVLLANIYQSLDRKKVDELVEKYIGFA